MASDNEASCICDPNFAVICSFLEKFAKSCGITYPNFLELQEMLENSQEVPQPLVDLHVKLLRKARKSVSGERWERALIKFCHSYSNQDGWEIERFGYKKARLAVKLRILKMLLELQFDLNAKFKTEINRLSAEELRSQPLGRDKLGQTYWCQLDEDCNLRVYREDLDDETWEVVAKDREGMVQLIAQLSSNDPFRNGPEGVLNDDSNSLEIEKPIIDTGQVLESAADEDDEGEFEEIEDDDEETDDGKKDRKQLSERKAETEKVENSPSKDTKTESPQITSKMAAANGTDVSGDKSVAKKKTENHIAEEGKKSENSLETDKAKHSKPDLPINKDSVPDTAKELSASDNKKHTNDSNEINIQNKNISDRTKDGERKLSENKKSSETKNSSTDVIQKEKTVCINSAVKDSEPSSSLKPRLSTDSKEQQESSSLGTKGDKSPDKSINVKKDSLSIKGIPLLRPCITLRPIEQLVAKDRLPTLKLLSDSIIQKQNSQSISIREFNLDSKEKISQNMGRKNSMEIRDYPHQTLKSDELSKSIIKEITQKSLKSTNLGQKDETRNLHSERTEWKEGSFDLRPPMMKSNISGNGNRGLDLSGRKVPGIGFGQGLPITENLHKTQDSICDLSMKRPVDNFSLMKDTQRHSMNVLESQFYQNRPDLATDLTLRKPNTLSLNFSQTKMDDRKLDSSSKVEINSLTNISSDSLKSLESLVRDRESKDGAIGGTKRDLNDTAVSQAKKPRFDNFPKTASGNAAGIGEAIEEPLMLIRGEGSGKDCNTENSGFNTKDESGIEVSEAVEDPVLFIQGEGCGADCDAGNTGGDAESGEGKSSNTPDERKCLSINKDTDKSQESSSKESSRGSESSSLQEGSKDSDISSDTSVEKKQTEHSTEASAKLKISHSSTVEGKGSISLTTGETSSISIKTNPVDRSMDKSSDGQLLTLSNESSSTKDEKEISEPFKMLTENTNINKTSGGDKSGSQTELTVQDKGMKESINTKLKQFHSSESPQSSNQSHSFPISPSLGSSRVPPLSSSGTLNVSQAASISGIEVSKSIPSDGALSIERLSHSHLNNPHASNLKLQEKTPVSSMFPQLSSLHKTGSSDVLDMSIRKESFKGPGDLRKLSSSTASSSLDRKSDCFLSEQPHTSSMEALSLLNVELDKMKPDSMRTSEAPLPVTKRFLHQTSSTMKPVESVTLKIPEPDKGDHAKISPNKTTPKLWSIEAICAPDQKHRESRDVPSGECGTSNPVAYRRPELSDQAVPNKQKWPLGVQIIPKSTGDNASLKKSRWDIGRPTEDSKSQTDKMKDGVSRLQTAVDAQKDTKDSRNLPKDVASKVPIVDSFALSVDRISKSVESEEHFGKKLELTTSSLLNKMSPFSSSGLASSEKSGKESSHESHPTVGSGATSLEKKPPSHSNYPTSSMNMPLDVRLPSVPRKHGKPSDIGQKLDLSSDNMSKSNLPQDSQNTNKPLSMSLHKSDKKESIPVDGNSSKLSSSGKESVDCSLSRPVLSEKDKHGSFVNQNVEVDKRPAPRFFFGPGCLEFPDKKDEGIAKASSSNTNKVEDANDKRKNVEEKRGSSETLPVAKKEGGDKTITKTDASSERNIGKVIDFLTQKNTGKSLSASAEKGIAKSDDKNIMKGLGSAVDRSRKSVDGPGERSIDKVIGLLTEKSARLAETRIAEKSLDLTKEVSSRQPSKDIVTEKASVMTPKQSDKLPNVVDTGGDYDSRNKEPQPSTQSKEKAESHIIERELHDTSSKAGKASDVGIKNSEMGIIKDEKAGDKAISVSGIETGRKSSEKNVTVLDIVKKTDERIVTVAEVDEKKASGKTVSKEIKLGDPPTEQTKITLKSPISTVTTGKDEIVKHAGKTDNAGAIACSETSKEKAEATTASLASKKSDVMSENDGKTSEHILEKPLIEDNKIEETLKIPPLSTCKNGDKSEDKNMEVKAKDSSIADPSKSEKSSSAENLSDKVINEANSEKKSTSNDVLNKKPDDKSKVSTNENVFSRQAADVNPEATIEKKVTKQSTNVSIDKTPSKPANIDVEKSKDIDLNIDIKKSEIKMGDKPLDKSGNKSDGKDVSSSKSNDRSTFDSVSNKPITADKNIENWKTDKTLEKTKSTIDSCVAEEILKNVDVLDKNSKLQDITVSKLSENTIGITGKVTDQSKDNEPTDVLDKNSKPKDIAECKSSQNRIGITGKVAEQSKDKVPIQSPPVDKDNTIKIPDISDKNIIKPIPILATTDSVDVTKKMETSQMKEPGKEEKKPQGEKVQDKLKDKTMEENQNADLSSPVAIKPLTIQGKTSPGNIPSKMGQQGMMGSGKGRRKSVENITMGIMMSKLAGKTGLDSQTKFPVALPPDNQGADKVTTVPIEETLHPEKQIEKQEKEPALSPEKPTTVTDTPAKTTEKAETPPKRTGFITLKPIETLLEKPRVKFQDVKDVKHDFGFVAKPMEGMPLPEKPYLYPVNDAVTERLVDKIKTVPGLGVTPIIRHPLDQQKMPSHPGNVQPLRRPGVFTPVDTQKEILMGKHGTLRPELKRLPVQKDSVAIESMQRGNKPATQDDKSVNKTGLLPSVQSSEKLLQTLNTSVSIVEKPIPVKEVECEKIQRKMDTRDRRQDISVITKDLAKSPPKVQTSSKIQPSSPTKVQTMSVSKVQPAASKNQPSLSPISKVKEATTKVVQSKEVLRPSESKDDKKVITGDKTIDNKLLRSSVSVTVVTNIDKKKENTETKVASLSKSASMTKTEEKGKGKFENAKGNSVPIEKDVTKAAVGSPGSTVKSKEAGDEVVIIENSAKSIEKVELSEDKLKTEVKDEKTEKGTKEGENSVKTEDMKPKKEEISTGITLQSLTFDYTPDPEKEEMEIANIRTRFTRSFGKPIPRSPVKAKRGRGGKSKSANVPAPKKEEVEREEPRLTRSRRTRSSGPPPVDEPKKPAATSKEQAKKTVTNKASKPESSVTNKASKTESSVTNKASKTESSDKAETKAKPVAQKRRNSRRLDSQSEDEEVAAEGRRKRSLADSETAEDAGGKRRKLRSKRTPDLQLRRSVEEQKLREGGDSSSDEDRVDLPSKVDESTDESQQPLAEVLAARRGRPSTRARGRGRGRGRGKIGLSRTAADSPAASSDALSDGSRTEPPSSEAAVKAKTPRKSKARRLLGLDVGVDIILEETKDDSAGPSSGPPVRASRRIAQIKIKEEAERRKIEEITLIELKEQQRRRKRDEKNDKDYKGDKKKRKKKAADSDEDYTAEEEPEEPATSKKKKKKRKKRKKKSRFCDNPWQSTSGSSSSSLEEEEEEQEQTEEEEEESNLVFKSDHEFSPESDLENEASEIQPTRRARTAVKVESEGEEPADEHACQKCGKSDHPEWILLCDKCDSGWHGSCLRPALMVIPEGDWFCPPCEHASLLTNLEENLREYDKAFKRRENEELRRKRLAYVGISLDNVLPNKEKETGGSGGESGHVSREESSSSSESGSSSSEESEPLYHLRERRQTLFSYRFNEYDDLINSAIQDELDAVKGAGNQGRGKDIATIVNAEKEEIAAAAAEDAEKEGTGKKMKGDDDGEENKNEEDDEEEEEGYIPPVRKFIGRKKHRRLNSLDISSEDDAESDEDFKGSSSDDEEEEEDFDPDDSDDSDAAGRRRGGRRGKHLEPVRRSTRARTTRFDKEFINDDSDDSVEPRRKKTRRLWQESDSSESDSTWGRKKKRKHHSESLKIKSKKKKKKKHSKGSDGESPRNKSKNPRIKYGGLDDDDDEDDIRMPRTRGRKINYQEIVGSESEEELLKAVAKAGIESEDEYVASEEEERMMMEDEEEEEPEAEAVGEEEEDEEEAEAEGADADTREVERKAKAKEEEKTKTEKEPEEKPDPEKEKEAEPMVEKKPEEPAAKKPEVESKAVPVNEPQVPAKEDGQKEEIITTGQVENIISPESGKKKKEKGEKKPKAPRKPREKKPKPEKKPKAEKKPPKPRAVRPKKQIIRDDSDDELENFGEDFDDLEEGEIRLGAMLDEREELMDEELLDEDLMDEEKEMEDMLEEELLDEDVGIEEDDDEEEEEEEDDDEEEEEEEEEEVVEEEEEEEDLDDEDDELLAMREAELAHQQAELERAKEMKRLKKEAKKLEKKEQKKRGRKAKQTADIESPLQGMKSVSLESERMADVVPKLMTEMDRSPPKVPPIVLPLMSATSPNPIVSPLTPKRKGRGRGKAALAAAAAAGAADTTSPVGGLGGKLSDPGLLGTSMLGGVPPPRYPGPNQQQIPFPSQSPHSNSSVISRMLQSQPVSGASQSFTAAAAAMGHKYFGGPGSDQPPLVGPGAVPAGNQNTGPSNRGSGPVGQSYSIPSRGRIPSPYRQPPPLTSSPSASPGLCLPQYAGRGSPVRPPPNAMQQSAMPSLRMRTPVSGGQGPQMYHTSHHPLDPSPSGGGPISIASNNGVRPGGEDSPLHQPPAQIPPSAGSPLAGKSGPTPPSHSTPPPPPYTRGGPPPAMHQQGPPVPPPLIRFPLQSTDVSSNGRHPQSPFPPSSAAGNHLQAQPSPPPPHQGRSPAPGNFSPYHPPPPPNYHYGAYPPPPPLAAADDALPPSAYQGSPYPDHYASPDAMHGLQASDGSNSKSYDEEGGGEFGGLVSYFSSQREDDLDT